MAYTILNTDGTTLLLLADGVVDEFTTSLDLVGRNVNTYGSHVNNNFVRLLENFASSAGSPPRSPLTGQLWYDTTSKRLKIYDGGFKSLNGAIVSSTQPTTLSTGDLWWDVTNNQLRLYSGNTTYVIGPIFPKSVGKNGWVLPTTTLNNNDLIPQQVTLLANYGQTIGAISKNRFDLTTADSVTYFNTSTTATIVAGLTINGDISATGQITNKYLSTAVDIDIVAQSTATVSHYWEYIGQNSRIMTVLENMFPVFADAATEEVGVPLGSEARVACQYSLPNQGIQVRRYRVIDDPMQGISWQPYEVYNYYFDNYNTDPYASPVAGTRVTNVISNLLS